MFGKEWADFGVFLASLCFYLLYNVYYFFRGWLPSWVRIRWSRMHVVDM